MAVDMNMLRQALLAKAAQGAPAPEGAPPVEGLPPEGMIPPPAPEMAGAPGLPPGAPGMPPGMPAVPPEVQLAAERARVKDMLKRVRHQEMDQEVQALQQARLADIEGEANEMFAPKKQGR